MRQSLQHRPLLLPILLLMAAIGCQPPTEQPTPNPQPNPAPDTLSQAPDTAISYLALGDSYTIGTSVDSVDRWPTQLRDQLLGRGLPMGPPVYLARNGWTTGNLLDGITREAYPDTFDLVSLLIGVNNQFQGRSFAEYQTELGLLIDEALEAVQQQKERLFVLSIPDYGVTPFGQTRNPEQIAAQLDNYNDYARRVCDSMGILYLYITDISRQADEQPELIASDNLHPSGEQYRRWVSRIEPEVEARLQN